MSKSVITLLFIMALVSSNPALAMGDKTLLSAPDKNEPVIQNPALAGVRTTDTQVIDIKLLQTRPSAAAGVQPFGIRDVRDTIDPEKRVAALSAPPLSPGPTPPSGPPTTTLTCPSGTRFPAGSTFAALIDFHLPSTSGACTIGAGSLAAPNPNTAFTVSGFTSTGANIAGANGWTVNVSTIFCGIGTGIPSTIQISKAGLGTYSMTLVTATDGIGGGNVTVNGFAKIP